MNRFTNFVCNPNIVTHIFSRILHRLEKIDVGKAISYVASCKNSDGGFGCTLGVESHARKIFCCVGALGVSGALTHVDRDLLGWWLCEGQLKYGGFNGQPEKLDDVRLRSPSF